MADGAEPRTYRPTDRTSMQGRDVCAVLSSSTRYTRHQMIWNGRSLCFTDLGKETMGMDISVISTLLAIFPFHSDDRKRLLQSAPSITICGETISKALPASQHHVGCPKEERRTCIAPIARRVGSSRKWNCDVNPQTLIDQLPRRCSEAWRWGWVI